MIAHFDILENNKGMLEKGKTLNHYENLWGNFSILTLLNFCNFGGFGFNWKHTNTNVILYSLNYGRNTNEGEFNLLIKGNNPNIHISHEIHLCQLLVTNHVFLIKNILTYLQLLKYTYKERVNVDKEICRFCLSKVHII